MLLLYSYERRKELTCRIVLNYSGLNTMESINDRRKQTDANASDRPVVIRSSSPKAYNASVDLLHILEKSIDDIRGLVTCRICVRPMYEPYTIACGHTFCYSCLAQWFSTHHHNKTCPDCRTEVIHRPAPAYIVRTDHALFQGCDELTLSRFGR